MISKRQKYHLFLSCSSLLFCNKIGKFVFIQIQSRELGSVLVPSLLLLADSFMISNFRLCSAVRCPRVSILDVVFVFMCVVNIFVYCCNDTYTTVVLSVEFHISTDRYMIISVGVLSYCVGCGAVIYVTFI